MYNIISYKQRVIHVEDDIINFSPIKQNRNAYPGKGNNFGDYSITVLLDGDHLGNKIIYGNTCLRGNSII